jgi:hypothetical protein
MSPGLLASFVDMLGERFCTALNDTVIYDSNDPVNPDGKLITSAGEYFVTASGDNLVYVEFP